jgi:hypothetical protein
MRNTPHIDQGFDQVEELPEEFLKREWEGHCGHGGSVELESKMRV